MKESTKGTLAIVAAAASWGSSILFLRQLYGMGLSVLTILFFNCLFGLLLMLLFKAKEIRFKVGLGELKWFLLLALTGNLTALTTWYGLKLTTIANAEFLHYTMPVFAFIIGAFFFKEKIK